MKTTGYQSYSQHLCFPQCALYCVLYSQGEQINELLTKLGFQATPVGDGTEVLFSVVLFLGEKVLQQETKLGMLKQELKLISMQHQWLVHKVEVRSRVTRRSLHLGNLFCPGKHTPG